MSAPFSVRRYPLEPLFERILTPFEEFLRRTTAGGIVLMTTTAVVLFLATAFGAGAIDAFWLQRFVIGAGALFTLEATLRHWVNDGLMALFFLLVGLELKREILVGELSSLRDAALPVIAAIGGMVVPAAIYALLNAGTPGASGWGIPMATDIAFAVGILVLLSWRVPKNLIVFLTALAIADDLGAVAVIALFYSTDLNLGALAAAAGVLAVLVLLNRGGIRNGLPYIILGLLLWYALHASGIHATLAGILLAATIPARPTYSPARFEERIRELDDAFCAHRNSEAAVDDPLSNYRMASIARAMEQSAVAVQSPLQRIEHRLTPWVTFAVIPLFALANAGIDLSSIAFSDALGNPITLGVVLGLVLGKSAGIGVFSWLSVRAGLARLPSGVHWKHLLGASWLAGIGFTMSLFIAQLAFQSNEMVEQAKLGILIASAIAGAIGLLWLWFASEGREASAPVGT